MNNDNHIMTIDGHVTTISYEADINAFRGTFLNLSGYCDFVSDSVSGLQAEGRASLRDYVETCTEAGIEPFTVQSGG